MKFLCFLLPFLLLTGASAFCSEGGRQRILLDAHWRFQIEPKIVTPSGDRAVPITDWVLKESPGGEADAREMTEPNLNVADWAPAKIGEDITAAHQGKFVWFRTVLDPVLAAHPLPAPRSLFFVGAGQRAVVYLNGRKIVEHTDNVRSLNASEILQTGHLAEAASVEAQEIDGINQSFEVCIEPFLKPSGPNVLAVMIRATARQLGNGLRGNVLLCTGFPPETQPDFDDSGWREVHLPHDYVVEGTFDPHFNNQRAALPLPRAFYRRALDIPAAYAGRRSLRLDFDGIYRDSRVWLNGHYLGGHPAATQARPTTSPTSWPPVAATSWWSWSIPGWPKAGGTKAAAFTATRG